MKLLKNTIFRCIVAVCLICIILTPNVASAAVNPSTGPQASNYISTYLGYISKSGNTIQISYYVSGVGIMDSIGSPSIYLYESQDGMNYTMVKAFNCSSNPSMMAYNTQAHGGVLTYNGNANYYYKAYICVYAGRNGGGDSRYFWAN